MSYFPPIKTLRSTGTSIWGEAINIYLVLRPEKWDNTDSGCGLLYKEGRSTEIKAIVKKSINQSVSELFTLTQNGAQCHKSTELNSNRASIIIRSLKLIDLEMKDWPRSSLKTEKVSDNVLRNFTKPQIKHTDVYSTYWRNICFNWLF